MVSIRSVLFSYKNNLPSDWTGDKGLRALFPSGYSGSISPLKQYVFLYYSELAGGFPGKVITLANGSSQLEGSPFCLATVWFMADGGGRWFFGWQYGNSQYSGASYQAGMKFNSPPADGNARGYVDATNPPALTRSCSGGTDPSIAGSWPQLFSKGITAFFQVGVTMPDASKVWQGGFKYADLSSVPLSGSAAPAQGTGSGSTLFPFPRIGADSYVAAIVGSYVAKALKAGKPIVADENTVTQFVSSPGFSSPSKQSVLDFLNTPASKQVIADSQVVANQVFSFQSTQGGQAIPAGFVAGSISSLVSQNQIVAAGTAAYQTFKGYATGIPSLLWQYLESQNTNPTLAGIFKAIDSIVSAVETALDDTSGLPLVIQLPLVAFELLGDLVAWISNQISPPNPDQSTDPGPDPASGGVQPPDPPTPSEADGDNYGQPAGIAFSMNSGGGGTDDQSGDDDSSDDAGGIPDGGSGTVSSGSGGTSTGTGEDDDDG